MTTHIAPDYESVLKKVINWSAADRFALVHEVLESLAPVLPLEPQYQPSSEEHISDAARQFALDQLDGMLASDRPPPTDEEIRQLLEERRMRRAE